MEKSPSLAIVTLALACLFLTACQTAGTPKQSGSTPTKSRAAAGPQAPASADSARPKKTAIFSKDARPDASPQLKALKSKKVNRLGNLSRLLMGQTQATRTLRAILYAALALILAAVIGAIMAERATRQRKPTRAVTS